MSSTSILLFIVGIWIILNAPTLVGVLQGNQKISLQKPVAQTAKADTGTTTGGRVAK